MTIFADNVSFAILASDATWRRDLSQRYAEYWSSKFNGELFKERVYTAESMDAALSACRTGFLIIETAGHVLFDASFFERAAAVLERCEDVFIGNITIADDYAQVAQECVIFNMARWAELGCPAYNSSIRNGPSFVSPPIDIHKYSPLELNSDLSDTVGISAQCAAAGGGLIARQLHQHQKVRSLKSCIPANSHFFLDRSTPAAELLTETQFEKRYLPEARSRLRVVDTDDYSTVESHSCATLVVPARGLKPLTLTELTGATKIIIYDSNPLALALQRLIFSSPTTRIFGEIIQSLRERHPSVYIEDDYSDLEYTVVQVPHGLDVQYVLIDLFSYEARDLIAGIDPKSSALFDFSDLFCNPHSYYKRPLAQVMGLFAELYGIIKSRMGVSHILGSAPGFKNMSSVKVNTFVYEIDETPLAEYAEDSEEPVKERLVEEPFIPEHTQQLAEEIVTFEDLSREQEQRVALINEALLELKKKGHSLGYVAREQDEIVILSKIEVFADFSTDYVYRFDPISEQWSFHVNKCGRTISLELANGQGRPALLEHMAMDNKINPRSVGKLL